MHQYRYQSYPVHLYDTRASRHQQQLAEHCHPSQRYPHQLDDQQQQRVAMTMPPQRQMHHIHASIAPSAELGMDWRGGPGGAVAEWDGCRSYPAGPATQMPAMNGVVQVQRRQMSYNAAAAAAAAAAAGATGYTSIKQEYGRAIPPNGYIPNGMPPSEYVDAAAGAMMTSRPMTSLPPAMGGAKCQQPMGAQFSQQAMCSAPYTGSHPHPGSASRAIDVMMARTSQQMVPDRCTIAAAEAGSRGKVKSEKSSSDHYAQRVGPYPTPQQYMLNKRAKYASNAAPVAAAEASFSPTPAKPLDGVGHYPSGPGVSTGVRPLRHLSPADYAATQPPPSRLAAPSYSSVSGPAVYPPGVVRTHGQPQPAGFPGAVDCHGNPAGSVYPASSCHQQPSPVSAAFTTDQSTPHSYPVSPLPGNPTPPMTPGGVCGPSPFYQSPVDQKPCDAAPSLMDPRQTIDESRLTFFVREAPIMPPFRLEHNFSVSKFMFMLSHHDYNQVMSRPELDVQLKSFHHEDHQMKTNWPASVSVRVNNYQLEISRGVDGKGQRPVYLKHVCQPGQNMLQIAVTNCCCSHLFIIQLVYRPTVKSAVCTVLNRRLVVAEQSIAKIKRTFSQRSSMSSASLHEDKMTISLLCPLSMSRRRITLPARGIECTHIQCFDVETYLRLNAEREVWSCPICEKPALFDGLEVDQYVWAILQHLSTNPHAVEVTIDHTASWRPLDPANGASSKAVSPDSMFLPTLNVWLSQNQWMSNNYSPGGAAGPLAGGGYGSVSRMPVDGSWMPTSSSAPDYLGCLSQMSNSFLPSADDAGSGGGGAPAASGMARQNSGGDHAASLPPTPVGSQLSGSQICTPLDGQSLHPRTPSDTTVTASASLLHPPLTPQDASLQQHHRVSTDSTGGPLTPSHVRQRQTNVTAAVEVTSSDTLGNTTDRDNENVGRDSDAVDTGSLPLLGGHEANVAEALEMLTEDNLDPMDLLTYLGPDGQTAGDAGGNDADLLSLFS